MTRFQFAGCVLDTETFELRRDDQLQNIEPQVFDVLLHLVQHRDRTVTKEDLLDTIWGDRFVSESALTSRIKSARAACGDTGKAQRIIKTVHGRGYRFVVPVEEIGAESDAVPGLSTVARRSHLDIETRYATSDAIRPRFKWSATATSTSCSCPVSSRTSS